MIMCDYGIANQSKARVGVYIADQVVFKPSTHTFFFFRDTAKSPLRKISLRIIKEFSVCVYLNTQL